MTSPAATLTGRGVWFYPDGLSAAETVEFAQRLEALGYSALWIPDAGGRDVFALAARLLDHTESLVVASGVSGFSWNGLYHAAVASNAKPDQLGEVIGGSYGFVFLGSLAGPGISALLYGISGSYVVVFMYVGLMALFGAISVVPLRNRKASVAKPKNT